MSEPKQTTKHEPFTVALERMDFDALRKECGECRDENGVSLWHILKSLRDEYGVKEVNLI